MSTEPNSMWMQAFADEGSEYGEGSPTEYPPSNWNPRWGRGEDMDEDEDGEGSRGGRYYDETPRLSRTALLENIGELLGNDDNGQEEDTPGMGGYLQDPSGPYFEDPQEEGTPYGMGEPQEMYEQTPGWATTPQLSRTEALESIAELLGGGGDDGEEEYVPQHHRRWEW